MLGVASQVKSQPSASHVKSLVFGFKSSHVTHIYCMPCTYFLNFTDTFFVRGFLRGSFIILFGLNIFFIGLNWFYYILSKASDLCCQQVIFSKSQVMDSKSKSSPKSMREVASQVTSHKNGDSSRTRVQVTWLESTSLGTYELIILTGKKTRKGTNIRHVYITKNSTGVPQLSLTTKYSPYVA